MLVQKVTPNRASTLFWVMNDDMKDVANGRAVEAKHRISRVQVSNENNQMVYVSKSTHSEHLLDSSTDN
jgi:hypothetical protein